MSDCSKLIKSIRVGVLFTIGVLLTVGIQSCSTSVDNSVDTKIQDVVNPVTGRAWMDRNLGASRVATNPNDELAYGHLFQWGRFADGHENRNSGTTFEKSTTDTPGHDDYILIHTDDLPSGADWRVTRNDNLWQGTGGVNNPCPEGYRIPTISEWITERESWSSNDKNGAFESPLKLTTGGGRLMFDGNVYDEGSGGLYWSSSVSGNTSRSLFILEDRAGQESEVRSFGFSVRCIKG